MPLQARSHSWASSGKLSRQAEKRAFHSSSSSLPRATVRVLVDLLGDDEVLLWVEAHRLLGQTHLVLAQSCAVGGGGVYCVWGRVGDVGAYDHQRRPLPFVTGVCECLFKSLQVLGVLHALDVPAVGLKAFGPGLTVKGDGRRTIYGDVVIVVDVDELAQGQVSGDGGRLGGDTLHKIAVRADGVGVVVHDLVPDPVVPARQEAFGDAHPSPVGEALSQRPGRGLYAGGVLSLGVSRCSGPPLPEVFNVVQG